jgi:hypothetical protein
MAAESWLRDERPMNRTRRIDIAGRTVLSVTNDLLHDDFRHTRWHGPLV